MPIINKTINAHLGIGNEVFKDQIDIEIMNKKIPIPKISKNSGRINLNIFIKVINYYKPILLMGNF